MQFKSPLAELLKCGVRVVKYDVVGSVKPLCARRLYRHNTLDRICRQPASSLNTSHLGSRIAVNNTNAVNTITPMAGFNEQGYNENKITPLCRLGTLL